MAISRGARCRRSEKPRYTGAGETVESQEYLSRNDRWGDCSKIHNEEANVVEDCLGAKCYKCALEFFDSENLGGAK